MFLEITKRKFEELKKEWDILKIKYEVSDCTLKGDTEQMLHIEFEKTLTKENAYEIVKHFEQNVEENNEKIQTNTHHTLMQKKMMEKISKKEEEEIAYGNEE